MDDLSFIRRRRLLIILSIALWASTYVGLTFTTVSVLGNSANIGDPKKVEYLAYGFWLFALASYAQSFHAIGAWKRITNAYITARNERILRAMRNAEPPPEKRAAFESAERARCGNQTGPDGVLMSERLLFGHQPETVAKDHDGKWKARVALQAFLPIFMGGMSNYGNRDFFDVEIPRVTRAWCAVKAMTYIVARAPYFTDYLAPFVIALLPVPHGLSIFWSLTSA
jgi:hypothetical protein